MSKYTSGKVVVRLLPNDVSGDYEIVKQSQPSVVSPAATTPIDRNDGSTPHTTARKPAFDPVLIKDFKLRECTSVALDVFVSESDSANKVHIHLNRLSSETVEKALKRMGLSLSKKLLQKQKGGKKKPDCSFSLLRSNGSTIEIGDQTHQQFWPEAMLLQGGLSIQLKIENIELHLSVECCPPTLVSIKTFEMFGSRLFVGIPLVLRVAALFSSKDVVDWYVGDELVQADCFSYTPCASNIGKSIAVVVKLWRADGADCYEEAFLFKHVVEKRPGNDILELRPTFCKPREHREKLRVLSYNILADLNALSDLAQTSLYPYCESSILVKERRLPLVLHEILAYQADVICLQEVDYFAFYGLLKPVLEYHGYQGFYSCKSTTREGGAMFWSLEQFEKVAEGEMKSHAIRDLFDEVASVGDWTSMKEVFELLAHHSDLNCMLREKLGHVLQTVCLTRRGSRETVVVGNTHLFFHPMASHVRLLQLFGCLRQMDVERKRQSPIIFCGDLNSSPKSGAARLFFDREVGPSAGMTDQGTTWKHLHTFSWECGYIDPDEIPDDAASPPTIRLPDSFPHLCSGYPDLPDYTHYIGSFAATLDYVLVSQSCFDPVTWAEMPSKEVLTRNVAMPS